MGANSILIPATTVGILLESAQMWSFLFLLLYLDIKYIILYYILWPAPAYVYVKFNYRLLAEC